MEDPPSNYLVMLREVSSLKTLAGKERRDIITFFDTSVPGEPHAQILPAKCVPGKWTRFESPPVPAPLRSASRHAWEFGGGSEHQVKTWEVRVNGDLCACAGMVKPKYSRTEDPLFEFAIPLPTMNRGYNLIELAPNEQAQVIWWKSPLAPLRWPEGLVLPGPALRSPSAIHRIHRQRPQPADLLTLKRLR